MRARYLTVAVLVAMSLGGARIVPVAAPFGSLALAEEAPAAPWAEGTLAEALKQAQASRRWVIVDLFATWCSQCHEMDAKVWAQPELQKGLAASFIALRRDGERGEGAELVRRYHVVGYPTLLVLDDTGQEIDRLTGMVSAPELLATLCRFRAGQGTLAALETRLSAAPKDAALALEVATRQALRGDPRAVAALSAQVKGDPANAHGRAAAALLVLGKYYYLRGAHDYAHAASTLLELLQRFPKSAEATKEAPYHLAIAYHALGRDPEARALLDKWLAASPADGERYGGYAWLCFQQNFERDRGIQVAKQGLAVHPHDDALWDTLGELYAATGKLDEAREAERQALALAPGDRYYTAQLRRFGGQDVEAGQ